MRRTAFAESADADSLHTRVNANLLVNAVEPAPTWPAPLRAISGKTARFPGTLAAGRSG